MATHRNLAEPVHQQFVEDNDARYKQWIKEAIENDSHGGRKNNRMRAWARHRGLRQYDHCSNVSGVEFQREARVEKKMEANRWDPVSDGTTVDMVGHDFPSARSQVIAKQQKEMMKLVQGMPDSNYELTLQDIVEKQDTTVSVEKSLPEKNTNPVEEKKGITAKRQNVKRKPRVDGGVFLLKMFLPVTLEGKHKNNKARGGSKVMPKHIADGRPTTSEWMSSKNNNEKRGLSCWSFFSNK